MEAADAQTGLGVVALEAEAYVLVEAASALVTAFHEALEKLVVAFDCSYSWVAWVQAAASAASDRD